MAQHKPALRTHSALNMLLSCGDALLSTGECLGAIDYYVSCLSALDASISGVEGSEFYVPEAVLDQSDSQSVDASFNTSLENPQLSSQDHDKIYVSVLPADTTTSPSIIFRFGKNAFHLFDHKNSQWYLLRYQILRKLLLCAQLADDPKLYCKTALDLLSKDMRRYCEEEDTGSALSVSMVADLNPLCRGHNKHSPRAPAAIPVPSVSPEEVPVSVSWGFTVSFLEYFSYQIIFDDSRFLSSRATIVSDKRKFSVPLIVCDGGEVYDATFELTSALPGYLEVDKIEVVFESVSSVDDEINAVYEFTCSIFPSSAGSSSDSLLTISPSSQLFKIGIRPLVSGVYRMRGLRITMAGIEFYSAISTHNTEFALSVRSPDRNLQTQVLAPSFTPFGCLENLQINISSIDHCCELIVERITLLSSMESKLAAVSLEAPQEHSDLVDVETGSYSKLGRANCFSSSGDSSHINVILDQFGREYINVPFDSRTNKHNQTVCIFFILDNHSDEEARDDRDDTYLLQISSLKTHNIDSKSPEICIHISASINHNGCRLRYGRLLRVPLTVGSGLEISASAVAFNGTEFIEQFLFINSSPVPVYLAGYGMKSRSWACSTDYSNSPIQSIPDSNSINRFIVRTRSEDLPFIGESSGYALTSGLKIGPGEEYFAHFNIFAERSSQNSFIKSSLSDVVFRFYCQKMILSDQNSKQKVAELFAINHPVAVPSERDDCYAPFAFELRISRLLKPINTRISSISVLDLEYTLSVTYTNSALQVNTMFLIEPTEGVNWMITNHYKRFMTLLPAESTKLVLKYARILSIQNDSEIENPPALRVWFNASSTDDSPLTNSNTEFGKSVLVKPVFVDDVCFT